MSNLVGTYWRKRSEKTVYTVTNSVGNNLYENAYIIKWLIDAKYKNPNAARTRIYAASSIAKDIQITEDEYLLMLVK